MLLFLCQCPTTHRHLHSFPTRRSSDLLILLGLPRNMDGTYGPAALKVQDFAAALRGAVTIPLQTWDERLTSVDRKSTRLNSSHPSISYAVFCLKKKKHTQTVLLLQHSD